MLLGVRVLRLPLPLLSPLRLRLLLPLLLAQVAVLALLTGDSVVARDGPEVLLVLVGILAPTPMPGTRSVCRYTKLEGSTRQACVSISVYFETTV
jgi:hypothetical protein